MKKIISASDQSFDRNIKTFFQIKKLQFSKKKILFIIYIAHVQS